MKKFHGEYRLDDTNRHVSGSAAKSDLLRQIPLQAGTAVIDSLDLAKQFFPTRDALLDQVAVLGATSFAYTRIKQGGFSARGSFFKGMVDLTWLDAREVRLDGATFEGRLCLDSLTCDVLGLAETIFGGEVSAKDLRVRRIEFNTAQEAQTFRDLLETCKVDVEKIEFQVMTASTNC